MNKKKYALSWGSFVLAFISIFIVGNLVDRFIFGVIAIPCVIIMVVSFYFGLKSIVEKPKD